MGRGTTKSITPQNNWSSEDLIALVLSLISDVDPILNGVKGSGRIRSAWISTIIIDAASGEQDNFYFALDTICCSLLRNWRNRKRIVECTGSLIDEKNIIGIL